jgi:nitrate reductase gamma subunit
METSKATIAGVLDIACGVLGLIGGSVLLILGLVGAGVIAATVPSDLERLSILPLALFVPLSLMTLGAQDARDKSRASCNELVPAR